MVCLGCLQGGSTRLDLRSVLQHAAGASAIQVEGGRGRDVDGRRSVCSCLNVHNHPVVASQRVGHAHIHRPREALQGWKLVSHCKQADSTSRTTFVGLPEHARHPSNNLQEPCI